MQIYKTVAIKGYMVEFYHKEDDKKLSFRIQDNEKLTDVLLAHCSKKRVKAESISIDFAIRGIREKIEHGILDPAPLQTRTQQVTDDDYCTKINLYAQKEYGESVYFDTYPRGYETEVILTMPDGEEFPAVAANKKLAKQIAASMACKKYNVK